MCVFAWLVSNSGQTGVSLPSIYLSQSWRHGGGISDSGLAEYVLNKVINVRGKITDKEAVTSKTNKIKACKFEHGITKLGGKIATKQAYMVHAVNSRLRYVPPPRHLPKGEFPHLEISCITELKSFSSYASFYVGQLSVISCLIVSVGPTPKQQVVFTHEILCIPWP